ncbi:HNH endonuclease [Streptomyces sp. NBC_01456]|uniref:HNH endonuclease n=1 Tax=unclassified Streptomyces TaxID=2593676 RepID=UPI002E337AE9|nr:MULTISPECIES: HNH endonuclease signature motif containing protein [unclassified Streptomyces]
MTGRWEGSTRHDELPADWPAIRAAVLARDEHRCRQINEGRVCRRWANQVDHIRRGNDHRPENLQSLCAECHAIKSSREGNAAPRITRWRPTERHPGLL